MEQPLFQPFVPLHVCFHMQLLTEPSGADISLMSC